MLVAYISVGSTYFFLGGGGVSIITACTWLVCILVPLVICETQNYALRIMVDLCWQVKYWGAGGGIHAPICSQHVLLVSNHSHA